MTHSDHFAHKRVISLAAALVLTSPLVTAPAAAQAAGSVVAVDDEVVEIDLGSADGLEVQQRIAFSQKETSPAGDSWETSVETSDVVGVVTQVRAHRARVRIGFGEVVRVGDRATITDGRRTRSLAAPPRTDHLLEVGGSLRVGLPLHNLGANLAPDLFVSVRPGNLFFADLRLYPTGVSIAQGEDFAFGGGSAVIGIDHRFFAVGTGVSLQWAVDEDARNDSYGPTFGVPLRLRLGSADGLHAQVETSVGIADEEFVHVSTHAQVQFPIANGTFVIGRGGGGLTPVYHVEWLVRHRLQGNGGAGTTFIEGGLGLVGVVDDNAPVGWDDADDRLGPSVVVGVSHRL